MTELRTNPEFEKMIEPLDVDERNELMSDLQAHGCLYPILTWRGVIVDGHTRYRICREHKIPFETREMQFEDKNEVKAWILTNQLARRNLPPFRKFEILTERNKLLKNRVLRLKRREKNLKQYQARNGEANAKDDSTEVSNLDTSIIADHNNSDGNDNVPIKTREELAKELGVGTGTVARMDYIRKKADEHVVADDVLEQLRAGKVSVNKVYDSIKQREEEAKTDGKQDDNTEKDTGEGLDGESLYSSLKACADALEDLTWRDISLLDPYRLRPKVVNKLQILQVKIRSILDDMTQGD